MRDFFYLGSSPANEDCVQVDSRVDYIPAMREELNRYKKYLEELFPIPDNIGCYFKVNWEGHDFGRYGEVVIVYNDDYPEDLEFAINVENNLPGNWDDVIYNGILFSAEDYKENKKRGMLDLVVKEAKQQQGELK